MSATKRVIRICSLCRPDCPPPEFIMEHRGRGWYWLVNGEYIFLGDGLRAVIANMYDQEWLDDHSLPMPKPQEHTLITQPPWKSTSQCKSCLRLTQPHPENGRFYCRFCDEYHEPKKK